MRICRHCGKLFLRRYGNFSGLPYKQRDEGCSEKTSAKGVVTMSCYDPLAHHSLLAGIMRTVNQTLSTLITSPTKRSPRQSFPAFSQCPRPSQSGRHPAGAR